MCDCYDHPCKVCGKEWPIHLEDFATDREEINVYCNKCFKVNQEEKYPIKEFNIDDEDYGKHSIIIEYLTDNAVYHNEGNHPNCNYEIDGEYVPKEWID